MALTYAFDDLYTYFTRWSPASLWWAIAIVVSCSKIAGQIFTKFDM